MSVGASIGRYDVNGNAIKSNAKTTKNSNINNSAVGVAFPSSSADRPPPAHGVGNFRMAMGRFRGQQTEAAAAPVAATSVVGGGAAGGRRPAAVTATRAPRSKSTLHAAANPFSVFGTRRAGDPVAEMSSGAVLLGGGDGVAGHRSPPPLPASLPSQSIFAGTVGRRGAAQAIG
ncbi:unnamed protein product, partial [Sphacelaria rigidula]